MAYTTVANVVAMFPGYVDNAPNSLSDAMIQILINDVAAEIDATLQRRFGESIAGATSFAAWIAALSADAVNLLERINRRGAAGEMADALKSSGAPAWGGIADAYARSYLALVQELNAELPDGKPKTQGGRYDKMFDPSAKTATPRPQLSGIAGGEMPKDQSAADVGLSNYFDKFGSGQD